MNLALLKGVEQYLQDMRHMLFMKRKDSNLFMLALKDKDGQRHTLYCDMTKSHSTMFISQREMMNAREFSAPFDIKLAQYTTNAEIKKVQVDGENRILQFFLTHKGQYKKQDFWLMCEFTGRHTNVILCDAHRIVIEALRHIPQSKSWREVRVGAPLASLPQKEGERTQGLDARATQTMLYKAYTESYLKAQERNKHNTLMSLRAKQEGLEQILSSLPRYEELIESALLFARYGELLFAHLHDLPPYRGGEVSLELKDFDGKSFTLPLPAHIRDWQEAGNWYYTQSKKYNKKAKHLHLQQENLEHKIQFLRDEIAFIERFGEVEIFAPHSHKAQQKAHNKELESLFIAGYKISIGRNAKENQKLLESARAEDMWLHIKDVPSAHLIIHCGKKTPPNEVLSKSAEILVGLYVSRSGRVGDFVVDYTKRRFVKPSQNAQVTYARHKSIVCRVDMGSCKGIAL